jgi:predicted ArsR family transcriptional regulator
VEREQQLTAVLADSTRYRIYRSIVERPRDEVTVADIAELFGLHPNVARMHLGKLEAAGLLDTSLRKSSGGGRPAKLYRLSDKVSTIALPPRRYDLLAGLALEALTQTAELDAVVRVCRETGRRRGTQILIASGDLAAGQRDTIAETIIELADEAGMVPGTIWDGDALTIEIRNCVFKELSTPNPDLVCAMHHAYLEGVIEALSGDHATPVIDSTCAISHGDASCRVKISFS